MGYWSFVSKGYAGMTPWGSKWIAGKGRRYTYQLALFGQSLFTIAHQKNVFINTR